MKAMKSPLLMLLALAALGLLLDQAFDPFIQLMTMFMLINMLLGMSLNLVNGYTGQFSLGHAGFMAVGAYSSAFLAMQLAPAEGAFQWIFYLGVSLVGGLVAGLAGWIVGLPSLRLKGDYLAIVTLGFGEIIRVILLNTKEVGGARGFFGIRGPEQWMLGSFQVSKFLTSYLITIVWATLCFFVIWRLIRSGHGRAFLAVREDEVSAEAMGVDTTQAKVRAFVISSFFAGVAGSLFAHYNNYLNPSTFSFQKSVDAVIIVVLGGMGSMSGSLMAAAIITLLPEVLRPLQEATGVDLRMVIYSLCLILLMILRPKGIMGHLEIFNLIKNKWRKKGSKHVETP